MERFVYKEQLIIKYGEFHYRFYLFNKYGTDEYIATNYESCIKKIDSIIDEQGGYYNCDGELVSI